MFATELLHSTLLVSHLEKWSRHTFVMWRSRHFCLNQPSYSVLGASDRQLVEWNDREAKSAVELNLGALLCLPWVITVDGFGIMTTTVHGSMLLALHCHRIWPTRDRSRISGKMIISSTSTTTYTK